tara:strand:+ start:1394 stop:3106 length:1713 start_codon:yes stop_codon:yes gene_type:complete
MKMVNEIDFSKENEINFQSLINLAFRNKATIIIFSGIFLLISCIYAVLSKRVWEGKFEIVLRSNNSEAIEPAGFASKAKMLLKGKTEGVSLNGVNIPTEIVVLNSSSVLKPTFEYVKNERIKSGLDVDKFTFKDWKKGNFFIDNPDDTSVLLVRYRDSDKKLISQVLSKISNAYQEYSGKRKKRQLKLSTDYLNDQIGIYKNKSSLSLKNAQEYAIEQDLNYFFLFDDFYNKELVNNSYENLYNPLSESKAPKENIDFEIERISAANQIKIIDNQIKIIREIKDDIDKLSYIGSTIPILVSEGLPQYLKEVDQKLLLQRTKYTSKDKSIFQMEMERDLLADQLRKRAIGILSARRDILVAKKETYTRPKEVILKYKSLVREAQRDENTLISLEDQLKLISLENAKSEDPWELITNPIIDKRPFSPKRKKIAFIGLISGFISGLIFSKFKEIFSGKVFEISQILEILNDKNLKYVEDGKSGELFLSSILTRTDKKIMSLIDLNKNNYESCNSIKELKLKTKIKLETDLKNISDENENILIVSLGALFAKDIQNLKMILDLNKIKLSGIILI